MNKRTFLKVCVGVGAAAIAGGALLSVRERATSLSFSALPEIMKALYDPNFANAFSSFSMNDLLAELDRRGVYVQRRFSVSQIRVNASSDSLVEFDRFLYTESELLLYAAVARWGKAGTVYLE